MAGISNGPPDGEEKQTNVASTISDAIIKKHFRISTFHTYCACRLTLDYLLILKKKKQHTTEQEARKNLCFNDFTADLIVEDVLELFYCLWQKQAPCQLMN